MAKAGYIERGAVVDRGADDRQAKRGVHRLVKTKRLERDMPLVVVHADEQVGRTALGREERGVGRNRSLDIQAARARRLDCRENCFRLLAAEQAVLTGVRVEAKHTDLRFAAENAPHRLCAEFQTACLDGDWEQARTLNDKLQALHDILFAAPSPAPAKYALSLMGLCAPEVRLPLVECPDPVKQGVRDALEGLDLL